MADDLVSAVRASADRLGISPSDMLTAMSYETGGKLDPNLWGGKNNNYLGLIQFGPEERAKYGVKPGQTHAEQVTAAENFLRDRGLKPGMGLLDIYSTINAGRPGLYNASDAGNGGAPGTVADKVASMAGHRVRANALLGIEGGEPAAIPAASAPTAGGAPMSLAPGAAGGDGTDMSGLMAALGAVPKMAAEQNGPAPLPAINYAAPPGLDRARALARAMGNRSLG